ncbi:MAG TPA: lipopolysaccharide assembly protein LapB [Chromatiaceae bacterium]|jgi:lipopolysaccharide biosynthesis regulator YciM|nr:MAG: lipopolysaccharide assembly protein LapB [Thiohalocapsa sp. PB-PSB1]HBG96619.1 lipopolysaccharide assembly protein LapB [Chromatiaceae bacterium]HCS91429.1 lipopolysaccharide assembly protein LapB [Chromatiaceae bacterium]
MMELLFLLLPVAAASGWWIARRSAKWSSSERCERAPTFFRGLNYLLNEQPDKAIDVFLKLAEMDSETVETHLALGSLFRRRGEVDRAIRIHQNLVARQSLSLSQRGFALYELGRDYMLAGLFDRAESLFNELVEMELQQQRALRGLIEIYQAEKEWPRCLEMAERLQRISDEPLSTEIAQYHCEMAEECLRTGETDSARAHLLDAQSVDADCIRASMLQAQMEMTAGDAETAALLYRRVVERGPRYLPAMLPGLLECWRRLGRKQVAGELQSFFDMHPSPPLMLELSEAIEREQGIDAALVFLEDYLCEHADLAGAERLLELRMRLRNSAGQGDAILLQVLRQLLALQPVHQCEHCGFEARALHWQCPSCKRWGSIKAVEPYPIANPAVLKQRRIS